MRLPSRAIGLALLAAVAITCTDAPTGPASVTQGGFVPGRVAMTAKFSPAAAQIYGQLVAAGLQVTEVHIRLTGSDGFVLDTIIPFPLSQNELVIEIPVPIKGT